MRAVFFPDYSERGDANPYQRLLREALERRGVRYVPVGRLGPLWALRAAREVDVVHLHWLEFLVYGPDERVRGLVLDHLRTMRLLLVLAALGGSQTRVVFTVHNLAAHEPQRPWLARLATRQTLRAADTVVFHSAHARSSFEKVYGPVARALISPHPSFIGVYPTFSGGQRAAREKLGLSGEGFVFLIFGGVRSYKRIPQAIRAFRELPDQDAVLLVAGGVPFGDVRAAVEEAARGDDRVVLRLGHVPDGEVGLLHAAADAAVLNYSEVFSSSTLMLALSFALPVVAPSPGTADEVAPPPATVPFEAGKLGPALVKARTADPSLGKHAARAAAERLTWDRVAEQLERAYEGAASDA